MFNREALTASPATQSPIRYETVTPNDFFWKMLSAHRKQPADELHDQHQLVTFVALDPGETTGVAVWNHDLYGEQGQILLFQLETKDIGRAYDMLVEVDERFAPSHLRVEEYRVYNWMADSHSWSILHTPQLIGAIKVLAHQKGRDISFKLAQHAKAMWTDDNLKRCDLYSPGLKHARDACRHLLYYMAKPQDQD